MTQVQEISGSGNIIINSVTPAFNVSSGALIVYGGAGISGNTYVGGNVVVNGNIFMNGILVGTGTNFGTNPLTAGNVFVSNVFSQSIGITSTDYIPITTWVACGSNSSYSSLAYSFDYKIWTRITFDNNDTIQTVAYGNGLWVAFSLFKIFRSTDGINWVSNNLYTGYNNNRMVTYANGIWVTVVTDSGYYYYNGTDRIMISYSYDGINWNSSEPLNYFNHGYCVIYANGLWIVGCGGGISFDGSGWTDSNTCFLYSYDGINWTAENTYILSACYGIAFGNGMWVAVGGGDDLGTSGKDQVVYSYDGFSWTGVSSLKRTQGAGNSINNPTAIAYGNGVWVLGGDANQVPINTLAYSYDGINWTGLGTNIFSTNCKNISYTNGVWVAVGSGTNSIAYSYDGIIWTGVGTNTGSQLNGINFGIKNSFKNVTLSCDLSGALVVSGGASISGNIYLKNNLVMNGILVGTNGNTTVGDNLVVNGNTTVGGNLFVNGNTTVGGNLFVNGNIFMNGVLVGTGGSGSGNFGTNPLSAGSISVNNGITSYSNYSLSSNVGSMTVGGSLVSSVIVQNTSAGGISAIGYFTMTSPSSTFPEFVAGGSGTTHTLAYASNTGTYGQTMGAWTGNLKTIFTTQVNQIVNFTISSGGSINPGATVFVAVGQGTNTLAYSYDGIKWTGLGTTMFSNDAISVASGMLYSGGSVLGPYCFAIGSDTNSTNSVAATLDGVTWTGFGKSGFGLANVDSSCKIIYSFDTFVVFGGGTYNNIQYLSLSTGWTNMGTGFSSLSMTVTGLCYYGYSYYAVGSGTNTMATVGYSGGGTGAGTYGTWTGQGKTVFGGSGIDIASYVATAYSGQLPIAIGTNSSGNLVVSFFIGVSWTTVSAISANIGLTQFKGIKIFLATIGTSWVLIYGTTNVSNGNTLYYTNDISQSINSSSTWTGTLGSNVFYNGSTSRCTYALLGTATILPLPLCSVTTGGNMSVSGNISIGGNIFCSKGIAYVGSIQNTSDYRIKANVELLGSDFSVSKLVPVKYYNTMLRKDDVGFIAHEVQEVFPQFVVGEKDGEEYQSVNYTGLIAVLVKEIQQLKKENIEIRQELREIRQAMGVLGIE